MIDNPQYATIAFLMWGCLMLAAYRTRGGVKARFYERRNGSTLMLPTDRRWWTVAALPRIGESVTLNFGDIPEEGQPGEVRIDIRHYVVETVEWFDVAGYGRLVCNIGLRDNSKGTPDVH